MFPLERRGTLPTLLFSLQRRDGGGMREMRDYKSEDKNDGAARKIDISESAAAPRIFPHGRCAINARLNYRQL